MTTVKRITKGNKITNLPDQGYFDGEDWSDFQYGDIIWFDNYDDSTVKNAQFGMFVGLTKNNNPVLYLETNRGHSGRYARMQVHHEDRKLSRNGCVLINIKDVPHSINSISGNVINTWGTKLNSKIKVVENSNK